jgi:diguanylate cyclase (GGDEF)-like protein
LFSSLALGAPEKGYAGGSVSSFSSIKSPGPEAPQDDYAATLEALQRRVNAPQPAGDPLIESEALDLVGILSLVDETAYKWDITTDRMEWESNAREVLGVRTPADIATGAAFQFLISPEHLTRRHETIVGSSSPGNSRGQPYRVQYSFMPGGRRSDKCVWLEDHGRWWPGPDGRPNFARGVVRVINDRYQEEQRLLYRSDHDELTGQLNRIRLTEAIDGVLQRCLKSGQPAALLVGAINNLAVINETFGFDVGDEVLAQTARVMKSKLRGGDSIGRYSSNKFGIILNDCGPGAMRIAAERFMKSVREAVIQTSACQLSATISMGGVVLPDQANTVQDALSCALQALDKAKGKRQNYFMAYEPAPGRESTRRKNIHIADEVIAALDEGRMRLVLQPIVTAKTHIAEHYECLLRMLKPDGSLVSAGEFIPVAEQLGLSRLIDRRVQELAVDLLRQYPTVRLAVNVSGLTASDHEWLVALHRLTGGRKQLLQRLTIEITETAAIQDLDQSIAFVDTLKELGCSVAIDDFGAGYTSFKNLKLLKVDMVKIDGGFVKNLADDSSDQVFIKTLIELANTFGMATVAEWVTNEKTVEILEAAGITYMQGFHFSRPMPAEHFFLPTAVSESA